MQFCIALFCPLLLDVLADDLLTAVPPHGTDEIPFRPKLATPQLLLDRRHTPKNLSGDETLDRFDKPRRAVRGHGLDQEMDMITVGSNLQKHDFIPFRSLQTDLFEHGVHLGVKHDTSVLGRTHQVIDQDGNIVVLTQILAHTSDSITPRPSEASFGESDPH